MKSHIEAVYPLTPLQQGLLFHTVSHPGEPTYFEQIQCCIRGPLDAAAFQAAWNWVLARHPILRTAFAYKQAQEPLQVVGSQLSLSLDWEDWREHEETDARWQQLLKEDRERGFEMTRAPLMRLIARQVEDELHRFVWSHHHILLDGWSFGIVIQEVLECYASLVTAGHCPTSAAPRPFGDYIQYLTQRDQAADEAFWQQYLSGCSAATQLSVDRGQGAHEGGGSTELMLQTQLDAELSRELQDRCRQLGVSLSALVHAAWARLLGAYSGEERVMFGTTTAGRPPELSGVEQMVGLFINAVPLLVEIQLGARISDWLKSLQRELFKLQEHQFTGLSRIQDLSMLPRGTALFTTLLSFQNFPLEEAHLQSWGGIQLTDYGWTGPTNYPIAVRAFPGEKITLVLTYYENRLDREVAEAMLQQLSSLVERLGLGLDKRLAEVPVLTELQATKMLQQWNRTEASFDLNQTLHGLVQRQALARPDALAVVAGDERLSYRDVDERSNQMARHLLERGVRAGDRVGICTEKSAAALVGMLGIMKAGACYVPLDPGYPQARIEYMISDAKLELLLSSGRGNEATQSLGVQRICLDTDWPQITAHAHTALDIEVAAHALAYVIYTSGSSGQPKGVMLNHRGRVNNVEDFCQRFAMGPQDRALCVSSLSFDISVCDIFTILNAGGCLVFPSQGRDKDPEHWLDLIEAEQVTLWHSAPALMDAMLDAVPGHATARSALRFAMLDGDWIPLSMPDRVRAAFPHAQVVSGGGATELSIISVTHEVGAVQPDWRSVPYGKPMCNQSAYIVDARLEAVPLGVPGELLLGGVGIADGYFERPALSAERFIPHPWAQQAGERLYRTGDLARFGADGTIELLGRIDFQVKVRGVRIELGEIEATLRKHPSVASCLVSAQLDMLGQRRLAAYVVSQGDAAASDELRAWLRQRLPETLVPEAFVQLDSLPLSANGKVDRRALAALPFAGQQSGPVAPATALEHELASHWAGVLGLDPAQLDVTASFFDLGGNSLKALRACRVPGHSIAVTALYQYPSIRALAEHLGDRSSSAAQVLVPLNQGDAVPVAICVPYGGGHAGVYRELARALDGRVALHAVSLPGHEHGPSDRAEALQPIETVAQSVVQAAQRFAGRPLLVYGHCGGVALALEITRRLEACGIDVRALFVAASYPPHDPAALTIDPFAGQSDEQLAMSFAELGGFAELDVTEARYIGRLLRHDGAEARRYFGACLSQPMAKIRTPLNCLIGKDDPLTLDYGTGWTAWRQCAERADMHVLPGHHYFLNQHPDLLAQQLLAAITEPEDELLEEAV